MASFSNRTRPWSLPRGRHGLGENHSGDWPAIKSKEQKATPTLSARDTHFPAFKLEIRDRKICADTSHPCDSQFRKGRYH